VFIRTSDQFIERRINTNVGVQVGDHLELLEECAKNERLQRGGEFSDVIDGRHQREFWDNIDQPIDAPTLEEVARFAHVTKVFVDVDDYEGVTRVMLQI
jgi:hypothetical protein